MFDWLKKVKKVKTDIIGVIPTAEEAHLQSLSSNNIQTNKIIKIRDEIRSWHKDNLEMVSVQIRNATVVTGGWFDTNFKFHQLKLPSRSLWTEEFDALVDQLEDHLLSKGYKVTIKDRTDNNIYKGSLRVSWKEIMPPEGGRGLHIKTANLLQKPTRSVSY